MDSVESALRHVKPSVRALGAYTLRAYEPRIKLNQNESPYDVPRAIKDRIHADLAERPWNRYPPFVASNFIQAVSEATRWPADGILVANGSNELIQSVLAVTVGPGVSVVIPEPTFTLYRLMTEVNGGTAVSVPLDDELDFDVDAIIRAARETDAAVVVLCTPNNPTGSALTREEIERMHDETDALILLDQAYVEFGGYDAIPLLQGRPRLVVLRTFSKAMAMAGLRAGYMLADPALTAEVNKAKLPYNINFFTECAAAEVLRSRNELAPLVAAIAAERDRLVVEMADDARPARVSQRRQLHPLSRRGAGDHRTPTCSSGCCGRTACWCATCRSIPCWTRCLRVNAGTPEENDAFLNGLRSIMKEAAR